MPSPKEDPAAPLVDRVQAVYDRGLAGVGQVLAGADGFARRKPWAALGLAMLAGWALGRGGGGDRVRPVRRRR